VDVAGGAGLADVAVGGAAAEAELVRGVGADVVGGGVDGLETAVGGDAGEAGPRGAGKAPKAVGMLKGPPRGWSRVTRWRRPQR
jgi:hypothetical protein